MIQDSQRPRYILLVDDYEILRSFIAACLNEIGFMVMTASNGLEAIEIIDRMSDQVCMLITDLNMPVLDGVSLIRYIRQFDTELPIAVITAHDEEATLKQIDDLRIARFNKPLDFSALEGHLRHLLPE